MLLLLCGCVCRAANQHCGLNPLCQLWRCSDVNVVYVCQCVKENWFCAHVTMNTDYFHRSIRLCLCVNESFQSSAIYQPMTVTDTGEKVYLFLSIPVLFHHPIPFFFSSLSSTIILFHPYFFSFLSNSIFFAKFLSCLLSSYTEPYTMRSKIWFQCNRITPGIIF